MASFSLAKATQLDTGEWLSVPWTTGPACAQRTAEVR